MERVMMHPEDGRPQRDKHAIAAKAAIAVVDDGVSVKDAMARFQIGRPLIDAAVKALREARAVRT